MSEFTLLFCPICGSNKSQKAFKKPYKLMPFARVVQSLGRASLRTIRVITSPFKLDLTFISRRLLLTLRKWYNYGLITNEDIDKYLVDMVGEFNQWCRESQYKEAVFKGYVKTPETVYYSPCESSSNSNKNNNARRITKPWI